MIIVLTLVPLQKGSKLKAAKNKCGFRFSIGGPRAELPETRRI
tara:strand:- start:62 stop:190 length:129 start_codon:yes stop_codon:yes gene_type:complete